MNFTNGFSEAFYPSLRLRYGMPSRSKLLKVSGRLRFEPKDHLILLVGSQNKNDFIAVFGRYHPYFEEYTA
jgi:hypothetical protein